MMSEAECEHYKRHCQLVCPECDKSYMCRICHNDKEAHTLDRFAVTTVLCCACNRRQNKAAQCIYCGICFGQYACLVCSLFDDTERGQFHCDGCGLCRVGGRDNYVHCNTCGLCLGAGEVFNKHKCLAQASRRLCPVCLEGVHESRTAPYVPPCQHLLHCECFRDMLKRNMYACPTCGKSITDMTEVWAELSQRISEMPMPLPYSGICCQVLCKDCNKESIVPFHVEGLKCKLCGSFNTARSGGSLLKKKTETVASSSSPANNTDNAAEVLSANLSPGTTAGVTSAVTANEEIHLYEPVDPEELERGEASNAQVAAYLRDVFDVEPDDILLMDDSDSDEGDNEFFNAFGELLSSDAPVSVLIDGREAEPGEADASDWETDEDGDATQNSQNPQRD